LKQEKCRNKPHKAATAAILLMVHFGPHKGASFLKQTVRFHLESAAI